jgi:hypothetical protein
MFPPVEQGLRPTDREGRHQDVTACGDRAMNDALELALDVTVRVSMLAFAVGGFHDDEVEWARARPTRAVVAQNGRAGAPEIARHDHARSTRCQLDGRGAQDMTGLAKAGFAIKAARYEGLIVPNPLS